MRVALRIALCALGASFLLSPSAFADVTTDLIKSLQLVAAPAPVKQRADWRVPRKVMLLEFGKQDWAPRLAEFTAAAPHTQVIVVHSMTEALAQAPGTDVLVGFNPEICAPQLLAAATDAALDRVPRRRRRELSGRAWHARAWAAADEHAGRGRRGDCRTCDRPGTGHRAWP